MPSDDYIPRPPQYSVIQTNRGNMPNFDPKYLNQFSTNKSEKYSKIPAGIFSIRITYRSYNFPSFQRSSFSPCSQTPFCPPTPTASTLPLKANPLGFAFHSHETNDIPIDSLCCSKIGCDKGLVIISAILCFVGTYLRSKISSFSNSLT